MSRASGTRSSFTNVIRWARRFARTAPRFRSASTLGLVAVFLFGINTFLDSQTISSQEQADVTLDGYAGIFRFEAPVPYGSGSIARLQKWSMTSGVPVAVTSQDVPITELADDGLYYDERDWSSVRDPAVDRVAGRLPTQPGEIALVLPRREQDLSDLGREVQALGGSQLRIVGLYEPSYDTRRLLLAAPGTWSGLSVDRDDLAQVSGEGRLYLDDLDPAVVDELAAEAYRAMNDSAPPQGEELGVVQTAEDYAADTPVAWIERSPILFLVPGALLPGLVILVLTSSQARRLVPASRRMTAVGVGVRPAVAAPLVPIVVWAAVGAAVGALIGVVGGYFLSRFGPWGIARPSIAVPWEAVLAILVGLVVGTIASWWFLRMRVSNRPSNGRAGTQRPGEGRRSERARRFAALVVFALLVHRTLSLTSPLDGLILVCLAVGWVVLLVPEILLLVTGFLPTRRLRNRLVSRLIRDYLPRAAAYTALVALGVGLGTGVVVSVQSTVAAQEAQQGSTAPEGVVALDNDDAPSLPVADAVRDAAERVPTLREQTPVQLWSSGRLVQTPEGFADLADVVTTGDGAGVVFAAESLSDFSRLIGRALSAEEREVMESGGMVVTDPQVEITSGQVDLADMNSGQRSGTVTAVYAQVRPAPWFVFVPGYVLTSTAEELGIPLTAGALVYNEVPPLDAEQVLRELSAAGINPEYAEIHYTLPPVVPDVALVVWCAGFLLLLVTVSIVITRAQAESMRGWVARLHLVGVDPRWARGVLLRQHLILTGTGIAVGLLAALSGLYLTRVGLPEVPIAVPWVVVVTACLTVALSSVVALMLSSRVLTGLAQEFDAGE